MKFNSIQTQHARIQTKIFILFQGETENGTSGKLMVIAREDNKLQGVGLHTRQKVCHRIGAGILWCVCVRS